MQASTTSTAVAVTIMPEGKTTSTNEMKLMFFLSIAALAFNIVALIGYLSGIQICVDIGAATGGLINVEPTCTSISIFSLGFKGIICFFISIFGLPTSIGTMLITFIHWQPAKVLFGSQQLTNEMRARYSKPFQLKYMMAIQAILNGVAGILAGFTMGVTWWAGIMSLIAGICYAANVGLVFKHFKNPNVATSLNLEYGAGGGGGGGVASKALEDKVKSLEAIVMELQKKVAALESK